MSQLKQKWSELKYSERNMILYGTLFVFLTLIYFYAWKPYNELINHYQQQIIYTQEDINWLEQIGSQINKLKSGSKSKVGTFSGSFINTVDKSIKQNRLNKYVGLIENSGGDKVVIHLNKIAFNTLIKWSGYLKKRYGIIIKNIDLQREGDTNQVNARIILIKS